MVDFRITWTLLRQINPLNPPYQGDLKRKCVTHKPPKSPLSGGLEEEVRHL